MAKQSTTCTLSRSAKVKYNYAVGLPSFLLVFNINIWPNSAMLRVTNLQYLNDPDCDLSISPKVKCDGANELILMFNSDIQPTSIPLRETKI